MRSNKSKCEYEGLNWESVRPKYEHIKSIFIERYTSNVDEENNGNKQQFPRIGIAETIGKERIGAKVKKIRTNYKKAVDAGLQSGGGRVVLTFYNLCKKIGVARIL